MKRMWRGAVPFGLGVLALVAATVATGGAATKSAGGVRATKRGHAAAAAAAIGVPAGFSVRQFVAPASGRSKPDDITRLDDNIFVTYQNNAGPDGTPPGSKSTIVEFTPDGQIVNQWDLLGRCDGLTADPSHDRLLASVNEDANSSLYVIRPGADPGHQLRHLAYSPDPAAIHGGGTDAITVLHGVIYVTASAPSPDTPGGSTFSKPALLRLTIPRHGSVAFLSPVFADNAVATQGNAGTTGTTTLNLADPDSNSAVPSSSPRFAHDLMLASQADSQLVFASHPGKPGMALTVLNLLGGPQVDDVRWADTAGGDLYVVDQKANTISIIRGPFPAGAAYTSIPSGSPMAGTVGQIDLQTGTVTPFATGFTSPKGLLYIGNDDHNNGNDDGAQRR